MKAMLIAECDRCGEKVITESKTIYNLISSTFLDQKLMSLHRQGDKTIWLCSKCNAEWEKLMSKQKQERENFYDKQF